MKSLFVFIIVCSFSLNAQVGIGTTTPTGALDIVSPNMGMVLPRVTSIEQVTQPDGSPAANGTTVYDLSRDKVCHRINDAWICTGINSNGISETEVTLTPPTEISNYVKASNTDTADEFGYDISLSGDGNYMAVGAPLEDSVSGGINGNQSNNTATDAGAVYVYVRNGDIWSQQAYVKASFPNVDDHFGEAVALSHDGSRLIVGAGLEDGGSAGVGGNQFDNSVSNAGAAYVYRRTGSNWIIEAYLKSFAPDVNDVFGNAVAINNDGTTVVVAARQEGSNATGINGDFTNNDNLTFYSGAVYTYTRSGTTWSTGSYIKPHDTTQSDAFGYALTLSGDGSVLAVSSPGEDSNATGIDGDSFNSLALSSGAVYIFRNSGGWSQEAYAKASNTGGSDLFGVSLALSKDGNTLVVGASFEDSNASGVNGDQTNNGLQDSGAGYVFSYSSNAWQQTHYVKAANNGIDDRFGSAVSVNGDGSRFAFTAVHERSSSTGIGGDETDNSALYAGAAYAFDNNSGVVTQSTFIKASNTEFQDDFGYSISMNSVGNLIIVSSVDEASNATGINGDQTNNSAPESGAVYIVK